ncbi:CHRNB3 [Mytilus coruscus]|uniref:CHRNB3 n=1 Tax=Mytilus coruscus TaxID=42192 RepID=A0A6J8CB33_MYTCO|nr:CHRNB3 [Mytilus coruscus]
MFEEISETISIIAAIELKWTDGGISWQPGDYGNKRRLTIKQGNIWTPPIMLLNSIDELRPFEGEYEFMATLLWNGTVTWGPGGVLNAKCTVDISKFPFDSQTCVLQFGTLGLGTEDIILVTSPYQQPLDLSFYTPNANWKLESYRANTIADFSIGYNVFVVELTIKREPLYFTLMVVCPTLLFGLLNPLVYLLPVESGERIGLSMTILLSYAIFLTLVSAAIPSSSNPMCVLLIMMVVIIFVSGLIVTSVIIISALHHRDESREINAVWKFIGTRLPWKRKNAIKPLQRDKDTSRALPNIQSKPKSIITPPDIRPLYEEKENGPNETWTDLTDRLFTKESTEMKTTSTEKEIRDNVSWQDVVEGMDIICMIVSYVTIILILFLFFVILTT